MPPKAAPPNAWVGAPPVSDGTFAFAHGDFFAEASGHNRHRRATPQELKTHFTSGNDKDHPAHWFEAQLLHYGLQPSKTKSVARMRLFDAVNAGGLKVPASVTQIEGKLKKEWTKNDREAKKASKAAAATPAKAAGAKRKAADDAGPPRRQRRLPRPRSPRTTSTGKASAAAKPTKASSSKAASATKSPSATPAKKQTARRGGASSTPGRSTAASAQSPPSRTKQTARRGGISQGPTRALKSSSPEQAPMPKQYARRSNAFMARGRIHAPANHSEYPDEHGSPSDGYSSQGGFESGSDGYDDQGNLAPLGLLNGDYEIQSEDVSEQWDFYNPDDFELTLTISGTALWGRFNLGVYEGVMFFDERPMKSSHERVWFKWRGREDQGEIINGDRHEGWIQFLGDGRIKGRLDMQSLSFQGRRFPDRGTRSSVDARSMKDEWNGYNEDEYERENRARW